MVVVSIAVFIIYAFIRKDILEAVLFALSVAVGITPTMLPMIVNVNLTKGTKTLAKKKTLVKNIPGHLLPIAHHWLILHGRYICMARKPNCLECGIRPYCKYYNHNQKNNAEE